MSLDVTHELIIEEDVVVLEIHRCTLKEVRVLFNVLVGRACMFEVRILRKEV